ncbi:putative hydrolase of the HAD superfamily [Stenotrophomonas maltophilia]|jgi:putative hydrolase of the HAD superfamily|uniref:HAD family hydrolase n=1 Tax=Stenotrophomonas chelatiphaga TaxID=517011 RepID=UPI000F4B06D6|nr:HAD family hydrolase [Stenotrophomonas chelatiphaga]MCS4231098.1 putative hydrolase of the HAD superfamily [Stenotrophomonas chelatiphaga]ROQ39006.1 putative hydrolase of the HAD superfamily [Stenotrophomonas maltophilia]
MKISTPARSSAIGLVGFDGDDTLWKSEDYYRKAEQDYLDLLSHYIDVHDTQTARHLLDVQRRNLAVFGYGVKAMTLSMIEAAIEITDSRVSATHIQRMLDIGHDTLRHPVELIDGVRESVARIAEQYPVVLITKGDLFHQEAKIKVAQLHDLFPRIEIVSEKDPQTYARVLAEFDLPINQFVMVGNSLRSDIEPVVTLGGWGVHTPYAVTWAHETEHGVADDEPRMVTADTAWDWPAALQAIEAKAAAA